MLEEAAHSQEFSLSLLLFSLFSLHLRLPGSLSSSLGLQTRCQCWPSRLWRLPVTYWFIINEISEIICCEDSSSVTGLCAKGERETGKERLGAREGCGANEEKVHSVSGDDRAGEEGQSREHGDRSKRVKGGTEARAGKVTK